MLFFLGQFLIFKHFHMYYFHFTVFIRISLSSLHPFSGPPGRKHSGSKIHGPIFPFLSSPTVFMRPLQSVSDQTSSLHVKQHHELEGKWAFLEKAQERTLRWGDFLFSITHVRFPFYTQRLNTSKKNDQYFIKIFQNKF